MSIGKKLISAAIAMLVLVLAMGIVSILGVQRVGKGGDIILKASSHICKIQELRLHFEKVLMPPHDYLIYGDQQGEMQNLEQNLRGLKQSLVEVTGILQQCDSDWLKHEGADPLAVTQEGIKKIETIANDILLDPDPLGIEAGKLMKQMDAMTEKVTRELEASIKNIAKKDKSAVFLGEIYNIMIAFQKMLMPPHDYLILGEAGEQVNFVHILHDLEEKRGRIISLARAGDGKEEIIHIIEEFWDVLDLAKRILAVEDPLKLELGRKMKEMDSVADQVIMELETLLAQFKLDAEMAKQRADRIKSASVHFAIIVSTILIIGGLIGGIAFSSSITDPVKQLLQATKRVSAGDLTHKADVGSGDEIGELAKSFNSMTDALRTYQGQLIHAKEYIDNIIKSMIDTLIVVNPDGTIHTVNQATLVLLQYDSEDEVVGQPVEKLFAKDTAFFKGPEMERLIKEGFVRNYNTVYRTKEGASIPINLSASVMRDREGRLLGTVCVARDMREIQSLINDLKRAYRELQSTQAQLIQSSRLASMGVLAAGVAHEINNPMNIIINYAGLLEDEVQDSRSEEASYVQGILKEGQRIINIVQNLLAFARAERQEHTPCLIEEIIKGSMTFMEAYLNNDGIKVQTSFSPALPQIMAKASQLEQVFINLILNARDALNEKYSKRDPHKLVNIETKTIEREGIQYVRVCVTDYGIGIEKEQMDKIFDPFFTTKRAGKGTGLGLSITYRIIADHRGKIEVKSRKGEQTTFIIDLPTVDGWSKSEV